MTNLHVAINVDSIILGSDVSDSIIESALLVIFADGCEVAGSISLDRILIDWRFNITRHFMLETLLISEQSFRLKKQVISV